MWGLEVTAYLGERSFPYWRGECGRHWVAGLGGGDMETARIDCPFRFAKEGKRERGRNLEKLPVIEQTRFQRGNRSCIEFLPSPFPPEEPARPLSPSLFLLRTTSCTVQDDRPPVFLIVLQNVMY